MTMIKAGDLVRFKVTRLPNGSTSWLDECAKNRTPMIVMGELSEADAPIEMFTLGERVFEVLVDGVFISAMESELTKRGL